MNSGKEIDLVVLLKSYSTDKRFVSSQKYAKEYFDKYGTMTLSGEDECLARMNLVESLVELLNPSNEYTLLRLHYIENLPVERCAECMCISRRTAFRLLKKAHKTIYEMVTRKESDNETNND